MIKYNLSKSLIHAFNEVEMKERCPLAFKKEFLEKLPEFQKPYYPSTAMGMGNYFEFLVTGEKLRDGTEPYPATLKSGKPSTDAVRIQQRAEKAKKFLYDYLKIEDLKSGVKLELEYNGRNVKGILDILCKLNGKPAIIDLKMSGLIGNKCEKYGWHVDNFNYHKLQAQIYKWLWWKIEGKEIPFYYLVFSNKAKENILYWEVKYYSSESFLADMEKLESNFKYVNDQIEFYDKITSWEGTNDFEHCNNCPAENCEKRLYFPKPFKIYIS